MRTFPRTGQGKPINRLLPMAIAGLSANSRALAEVTATGQVTPADTATGQAQPTPIDAAWSPFAANDLADDNHFARFTVTGFSGYAVTAPIPLPGTVWLFDSALAGFGVVWPASRPAACSMPSLAISCV